MTWLVFEGVKGQGHVRYGEASTLTLWHQSPSSEISKFFSSHLDQLTVCLSVCLCVCVCVLVQQLCRSLVLTYFAVQLSMDCVVCFSAACSGVD